MKQLLVLSLSLCLYSSASFAGPACGGGSNQQSGRFTEALNNMIPIVLEKIQEIAPPQVRFRGSISDEGVEIEKLDVNLEVVFKDDFKIPLSNKIARFLEQERQTPGQLEGFIPTIRLYSKDLTLKSNTQSNGRKLDFSVSFSKGGAPARLPIRVASEKVNEFVYLELGQVKLSVDGALGRACQRIELSGGCEVHQRVIRGFPPSRAVCEFSGWFDPATNKWKITPVYESPAR